MKKLIILAAVVTILEITGIKGIWHFLGNVAILGLILLGLNIVPNVEPFDHPLAIRRPWRHQNLLSR